MSQLHASKKGAAEQPSWRGGIMVDRGASPSGHRVAGGVEQTGNRRVTIGVRREAPEEGAASSSQDGAE